MNTHRRRVRDRRPRKPEPVRLDELAEFLDGDTGWRDEVRTRLVARLDPRLVERTSCVRVAELAEELDTQVTVEPRPDVTFDLAKAVHCRVPFKGVTRQRHTARNLRVLGVYLCAVAGRDLGECPCAAALAADPSDATVPHVIGSALDRAGL
ncbi:hypothetical protein [Umezawaea tangerina]|uniref:Uncharacterized protein n=1 Tax=Umezawaea tangerina TaxID=84725 RepID=A0A2T0SC50_9PSEU|nr:hypothetical protein [Umezawaea tangerina]PRY31009.1 hypothetical protein CLV43_123111 [Umezawaea tangerina]